MRSNLELNNTAFSDVVDVATMRAIRTVSDGRLVFVSLEISENLC